MGWQAIEACYQHSKQTGSAYLLLLIIAGTINDKSGEYAIPMEELKQRARMGQSQVYAHLATLQKAGEITITKRGRRLSPTYRIAFYSGNPESRGANIPEIRKVDSGNPESRFRKSGTSIPYHEKYSESPPNMRAQPRENMPPLRPLWEVAIAEMGTKPETDIEQDSWKRSLQAIHKAGGSPDDLRTAFATYRRMWPTAQLSVPAIAKHWSTLRKGLTREQAEHQQLERRTIEHRATSEARAAAEQAFHAWVWQLGPRDMEASESDLRERFRRENPVVAAQLNGFGASH